MSSSFVAVYLFWFMSNSQINVIQSHRIYSQAHAKTRAHVLLWPQCRPADITVLEILLDSFLMIITIFAITPKNSFKTLGKLHFLFLYC